MGHDASLVFLLDHGHQFRLERAGKVVITLFKNKSGIAVPAIVIAVLALSFGDAVIKATNLSLPIWQMYILRSALAMPVLLVIIVKRKPIKIGTVLWVSVRSALLVLMWLCYYVSLPQLPLSVAAAAYYTSPIFITILAAIVTRKAPTLRIWLAIILGFAGVMLIVRPDATGFQWAILLPVLSAVLYAAGAVITSSKCRDEDPIVLVIALNIAFILFGGLLGVWSGDEGSFLLGPWVALDIKSLAVMMVLAVAILIGSVGAAYAYQNGKPAVIATLDYSYLPFSLIWGVIFFSEIPGLVAIGGISIIVFAGVLILPGNEAES